MNRRIVKSGRAQLAARHVSVLPGSDAGDFFRQTKVFSHNP